MATPPAALPSLSSPPVDLNNTLGVAFIGLIFAAMYVTRYRYTKPFMKAYSTSSLFGVTNVQSLIYYQSSESARDSKYIRLMVSVISTS